MQPDTFVRASFNTGGHPGEWTIHFPGCDHENYIPDRYRAQLAAQLGDDFYVDNRGSRLEITSALFNQGRTPLTERVVDALAQLGAGPVAQPQIEEFVEKPAFRRLCACNCGQELTMKEIVDHVRAARAAATAS